MTDSTDPLADAMRLVTGSDTMAHLFAKRTGTDEWEEGFTALVRDLARIVGRDPDKFGVDYGTLHLLGDVKRHKALIEAMGSEQSLTRLKTRLTEALHADMGAMRTDELADRLAEAYAAHLIELAHVIGVMVQ